MSTEGKLLGLSYKGLQKDILNQAARLARDYMKSITPKYKSGKLRRSIGITVLSKKARKVGSSDTRKYPRLVMLDIKPFEIRPKSKKVLRFMIGKKPFFAKHVLNPGGKNVIGRTEAYIESHLEPIIDEVMENYPKGRIK